MKKRLNKKQQKHCIECMCTVRKQPN